MGSSLKVHSPQSSTLVIKGDTALGKIRIHAVLAELPLAPCPCKEPSFIFCRLDINNERAFQFCLSKDHEKI